MFQGRIPLVPVPAHINSSYLKNGAPRPLVELSGGKAPADVVRALVLLEEGVRQRGGIFRVTELWRSILTQSTARAKYDYWVSKGKPDPKSANFNKELMKADFVAEPGYSFHNAGRAIDVHIDALKFPNVPADRQLDTLWEIAIPIGWKPVIKAPTEGVSESWHFDLLGEWAPTFNRLKQTPGVDAYAMTAMCACLDWGSEYYAKAPEKMLQAQLHRIGQNPGPVDGDIGPKTEAALMALGFSRMERDYTKLFSLA